MDRRDALPRAHRAVHRGGRGVVVRERGGTPYRQIFWSRNGAPANIVGHRWNANTEAFRQITSYSLGWPSIDQIAPKRGIWHQKSQKFFRGWHPRRTRGVIKCTDKLVGRTSTVASIVNQWRSKECELGGSPPLPPSSPPLLLCSPVPLLTGVRKYNPRNFFEIKGARIGEF